MTFDAGDTCSNLNIDIGVIMSDKGDLGYSLPPFNAHADISREVWFGSFCTSVLCVCEKHWLWRDCADTKARLSLRYLQFSTNISCPCQYILWISVQTVCKSHQQTTLEVKDLTHLCKMYSLWATVIEAVLSS